MTWIRWTLLGALVVVTLLPQRSTAATVSVVNNGDLNCITLPGGSSTSCRVNEIRTSLNFPGGGYADGQAGDTFEITVLFPGFIHDPDARYKILHLGPTVGLDTVGAVTKPSSSPTIFAYDVTMSLTDIYGTPSSPAVPIYSTPACLGCGWAGQPGGFFNQPAFSNQLAGGVRFVFTTSAAQPVDLRVRIEQFGFHSPGAFIEYSAPEPKLMTLLAGFLFAWIVGRVRRSA